MYEFEVHRVTNIRLCLFASMFNNHNAAVLKNGQDKYPKASLDEQPIMESSPGLPKDTKFLRSCSLKGIVL